MKRVLITGANSYIGTSFESWVVNHSDAFEVDTLDMIDGSWKSKDFGEYDSVFHVAGIAHQKETKENAESYYQINRDLAVEVATKAKHDGVKQFVFLSSMSIYGKNIGTISKADTPSPKSNYGKSKWQAEQEISKLESPSFAVAILRPPMVYGEGCKGNYQLLRKFALKSPVFPNYINKRSMINIDNLSQFVFDVAEEGKAGVFFPQDSEYVCTADMVRSIAEKNEKHIRLTKFFNPFIRIGLSMRIGLLEKVFGDLVYE